MNCDDVFRILTRGPFPCGDPSDEAVERHLAKCDACRRLAEALQPAIELTEESVAPEESSNLPAYWGELFHPSLRIPEAPVGTQSKIKTLAQRIVRRPQVLVRQRVGGAGRLAGAMVLGVLLGLALQGPESQDADERTTGAVASTPSHKGSTPGSLNVPATFGPRSLLAVCTRSGSSANRSESDEVSLNVPATSSSGPVMPTLLAPAVENGQRAAWSDVRCCSECHHAESHSAATGTIATAQIIATCGRCHER